MRVYFELLSNTQSLPVVPRSHPLCSPVGNPSAPIHRYSQLSLNGKQQKRDLPIVHPNLNHQLRLTIRSQRSLLDESLSALDLVAAVDAAVAQCRVAYINKKPVSHLSF